MPRLTLASRSHDPYWDLDGQGARRSRIQHRVVQWAVRLLIVLVIAVVATRLPSVDPALLTTPAGKPILAGALFSILGVAALLALARIRSVTRH